MIYDFKIESEAAKARYRLAKLISSQKTVDITDKRPTRSTQQNRALHLLFSNIAAQLNEIGETFNYVNVNGEVVELMFTDVLIKETTWKPIQKELFNIDSTTKLETGMINQMLDILTKFFGEKGIPIVFPNRFDLWEKQIKEEAERKLNK